MTALALSGVEIEIPLSPRAACRHGADEHLLALVHVRPDLEVHLRGRARTSGEAARQHVHSIELGVRRDPVDLVHQLGDLDLYLHPVFLRVDPVRRLDRQLADPVHDVLRFRQVPFGRLDEGHRVLDVPARLVEPADLRAELLRHRQTGRIVACPC